jgi:dihydrofolate reductase
MLIYSMSVPVDGFIADRDGGFAWTAPSEQTFRFHLELIREVGGFLLGRRLYEAMLALARRTPVVVARPPAA